MNLRRTAAVLAAATLVPLAVATAPSASAAPDRPRCTIVGTPGDDRLRGTSGDDVICGLGGDDVIIGLDGDDLIFGGPGDDRLEGGKGRDVLVGGSGDDELVGGPGDDLLLGQSGDDEYNGGGSKDMLLNTMSGVQDYVVRGTIATGSGGPVKFTLQKPASECVKDPADPPAVNTETALFTIDAEPWCIWGVSVRYQLFQADGNRRYSGTMSTQVRLNPDYSLLTFNAACSQGFQCFARGTTITLSHTR